jgi:hypothetical protein
MATDATRQVKYDEIRERFIADPDFRAELRADTVGTLTGILGELTEQERQWIREMPDASTSDDDLVEQLTNHAMAW